MRVRDTQQLSPPVHQGQDQVAATHTALEFLENHGKNILLSNGNRTATRVASYNQGIVVINQPLVPQLLVQVGFTSPLLPPPPPFPSSPLPPLLLRVTWGRPGETTVQLRTRWRASPGDAWPWLRLVPCSAGCRSVTRKPHLLPGRGVAAAERGWT